MAGSYGMMLREDLSERELLLLVADDIAEIKYALNGNGQPGLVVRVSQLEGAGSKTTVAKGGAVGVALSLALALLAKVFGVSV